MHSEVISVPFLSELISVIDKHVSVVDAHVAATCEILRAVVFNWLHVHVGVVSQNGALGKLLSSEEHGEGVATVIGLVNFLNFDCAVAQEVV